MNIFEDLIDELKEDNLIEKTVMETSRMRVGAAPTEVKASAAETAPIKSDAPESEREEAKLNEEHTAETLVPGIDEMNDTADDFVKTSAGDAEFYRKRAIDEVTFLQMVEAVFAGVERDQMKMIPQRFDDLEVKKVLHAFLQIPLNATSAEYSQAEFKLLQATEGWYSTLAHRDKKILTAHLRRYCENSRPPLSAPALIALARFYRNAAYSEQARSKFDFMMTRMFSKESESHRRELLFTREELLAHVRDLYADWSSIPLYATETDDAGILQTIKQFEEFIQESEAAGCFDELINNNFFNRLRLFKESTNEDFYAPPVIVVGIEANIFIGNRYVTLLEKEKRAGSIESVESKYGAGYDHAMSEITGKTMSLVELLTPKIEPHKPIEPLVYAETAADEDDEKTIVSSEEKSKSATSGSFVKWLAVAVLLAVIVVLGIYFVVKPKPLETNKPAAVEKMNIENSLLKQYLSEARISDETLNGVALPSWSGLNDNQKKIALRTMFDLGAENGFKKVRVLNAEGGMVGTVIDGEVIVAD